MPKGRLDKKGSTEMRSLSTNVQVSDKSKRVYADFAALSDKEIAVVTALIAGGYKLYPPTKKGTSNGKKFMKESDYLAALSTAGKKKFAEEKKKGFGKAVAWFNSEEGKSMQA